MHSLKKRLFEMMEVTPPKDALGETFNWSILTLIALNIVALVAETVKPVYEAAPRFFWRFELVSVSLFTAEYLLRLWSCTASSAYTHPVAGRLRFALRPMMLMDLLAILPFYIPLHGLDMRFMRATRLFRFLRVAKLGRYSAALQTLGRVVVLKKEELLATLLILAFVLLIASSVMYFVEEEAQPGHFSSIPASMWWGVTTLTTVGYGDVYPVTVVGKVLASVIAILGIAMFALPSGILAVAFVQEFERRDKKRRVCPHCGQLIEESVTSA